MDLVSELIREGWLKTPRIIEAFKKIKREDFVPDDLKEAARENIALPTMAEQTISQPLVVALMIEELQPEKGNKILDIGSGSGWTTAILSCIAGDKGRVIGLEIIPELVGFGSKNVSKYNFIEKGRVKMIRADGREGYPKEAPYDRILISAASDDFLQPWKEQLRVGGRIVFPQGSSILRYVKKSEKYFERQEFRGFVFVPLVKRWK
ncbi:MAG: protein-L-isoaspartate O-methyltransferase [Candidatus Pacebacteria bacterium]|nr:protein-L-isoaspartate O-methyltransferase [Candidatus Paceibacterota bacterium]